MIRLTRREIMEIIPNRLTFARSENYFLSNRVTVKNYDYDTNTYMANVIGTKMYNVNIEFDKKGFFYDGDCNCAAFNGYNYCKHIGAALFELMSRPYKIGQFQSKEEEAAKKILDFFSYQESDIKIPLTMEINYEYMRNTFTDDADTWISLRIGENKLYIVKSIKKFFESIDNEEELYFGKQFTYDPSIHSFSREDKVIIDLLKELYDNEKMLNDLSYFSKSQSLFSGKKALLPQSSIEKFLNSIQQRTFNCTVNDVVYKNVRVYDEDVNVEFLLTKEKGKLKLNVDFKQDIVALVKDGRYLFAGGKIHRISDYQMKKLKPFYENLDISGCKVINIPKKYSERFISEVYPVIKNLGDIQVDEKVEDSIYNPGLRAEIYLDRIDEKIIATIKFVYGDVTINAIEASNSRSFDNRIILRDVDKEREVLGFFEVASFKVTKNGLYLEDEDRIFDFICNKVPKLQDIAYLYYSENFKTLRVQQSNSYSGGVRLNAMNGLLEFHFSIDGIDNLELKEVFDSIYEKKKYYRLQNGAFLSLDDTELQDISKLWNYLDLNYNDFEDDRIDIPKYRALYIDEHLKDSNIKSIRRNLQFKELVQNMREPNDIDYKVPKELNGVLRDYQVFGFKWLKTLSLYGFGGILADDMGLGKTLQTLAFLLSEINEDDKRPSIIVSPTSLVYNWLAEIEKFTPMIKTLIIAGKKEERIDLIDDIDDYDVVITSYPLIRRDIEYYREKDFKFCILDEAQHIKNHQSQNARSVKEIKADKCFALTGTPIENSLSELWSIFDYIMPGYLLSNSRFTQKFAKPISKDRDTVALNELGRYISPFVLRRLKKDVLRELPDKIEHKVVSQLTTDQKKIYLAYLQEIKGEIEEEIQSKGFARSHIKILSGLTRLRQICCHPGMFIENYDGTSGKLELAEELINESLTGGHRILLFSQFTSMLNIVREMLERNGIDYKYLDGSTKMKDRGRLVKEFNKGEGSVFLISLKAGGTGLNLTGADTVIHFDPWWNPAVEDQATDRAHRIGQNKAVHVIKLVTKGTIEEKIFEMQDRKKKLIESVLKPGETLISKLSEDEIRSLFDIDID